MQWEGHAANTRAARAESSSEAASLKGHKALTPILAGSICGGVLALGWLATFVWYLLRHRQKRQDTPRETVQTERYVIPPDPATLQEYATPGNPARIRPVIIVPESSRIQMPAPSHDTPRETVQTEQYIIPPDPATLQEYATPGNPARIRPVIIVPESSRI